MAHRMMGQFPTTRMINSGPGHRRPNIIQLPIQRACSPAFGTPMAFNGLAQTLGLGQLSQVDPIVEFVLPYGHHFGGVCEIPARVMLHHVPAVKTRLEPIHGAALPKLKHRVLKVHHPHIGQRPSIRHTLKPELTGKTSCFVRVIFKSRFPEPHAPIVLIPRQSSGSLIKSMRRRRPILTPTIGFNQSR